MLDALRPTHLWLGDGIVSRRAMIVLALALATGGCHERFESAVDDAGVDRAVDEWDAGAPAVEADADPPVVIPPHCGSPSEWVPIASGIDIDLTGVQVVSASEAWITGDDGTLFRFDGGALRRVEGPPTRDDIGDLWVDPSGDIWVTTSTAAFRRTAAGWERLPLAPPGDSVLSTVWGTSGDDVWFGGGMASPQIGFLAHWNGTTISIDDAPAAIQVVRIRGDDAHFAVAHLGRVMQRDAARDWANIDGPDGETITSVWPVGPDEAFFGAVRAQIHHYRDGEWRTYDSEAENTYYYAIWGCSRDDVWALGWEGSVARFDGETLRAVVRPRPTRATIFSVDGEPGGLVLAVGENGTILRLVPTPG